MKKQEFRFFTILSLFIFMAAASVYAQSVDSIDVYIPFEFVAGDKTLPAGEYTVKPISIASTSGLLIKSKDQSLFMKLLTNPAQASARQAKTKLVFNLYGEHYFLSQVWTSGSNLGRELRKSHIELELAMSGSDLQIVSVIAHRQ